MITEADFTISQRPAIALGPKLQRAPIKCPFNLLRGFYFKFFQLFLKKHISQNGIKNA